MIANPDAPADYTHISDFANYLTAAICEPEKSENATLNFVSDHISHSRIAELLKQHSGKPVNIQTYDEDTMHQIVADPDAAPKELAENSML